ncbi:MAG: lipopolysaccharide biosynthesis protein [Verrucomicrobia bacterium]|nr:lipopolysaccharide biosynthesis protein [Verrucomicrobiota bacterium]
MYTLGSKLTVTLLQLVSTLVLARLLLPEDFGVVTMVLAITQFAGLFKDLGLSSAAIQSDTLTDQQQSNLFWINLTVGLVLTLLVAALAPAVAWFYRKPELVAVTLALSLKFFLTSLGTQHGAKLLRELRFGTKTLAEITGAAAGLFVAVALALQGFSYWALVWGNLTLAAVNSLVLLIGMPFPLLIPRAQSGTKKLLRFGAHVTGFEFVNYFHRNLDNLLIGRVWGADALGFYSRAYTLLMLPITSIRAPLNAVAFPALSRLQHDPENFRTYFRRVLTILGLFTIPMSTFAWLAAHPLILLALGPNWMDVVPIFSILAITSIIQPVAGLRGMVLMSLGQSRRYLQWGIINAIFISLAFLVGIRWGPVGIARAYAVSTYLILQPSLHYVFHKTPLRPRDFWIGIWRPLAASAGAAAAVILLKHFLPLSDNLLYHLLVLLVSFFGTFGILFTLIPGGIAEIKWWMRLVKPPSISRPSR